MKRFLCLLCLAVLPTTLQAQDERPKIDPAKREALRDRAAEIRKQVEELRGEMRKLRGDAQEPAAKPKHRRGGERGLRPRGDERPPRGERPARGEQPPRGEKPPRGERPPRGEEPRRREGAERGAGRELPPRMEGLRERFREAGPLERRMMEKRLQRLRAERGARDGQRPERSRELPRASFRRR
jgi:hypothetical protein